MFVPILSKKVAQDLNTSFLSRKNLHFLGTNRTKKYLVRNMTMTLLNNDGNSLVIIDSYEQSQFFKIKQFIVTDVLKIG